MKDNLDSAETSGKETAAAITALDGDPAHVQDELKAVNANHDSLMDQLKDKQSQLEQAIGQGLELQDKLDEIDRKSTRLNSSHVRTSRMPSSA